MPKENVTENSPMQIKEEAEAASSGLPISDSMSSFPNANQGQMREEYITAAKAAERKELIKNWRSLKPNPDLSYGRRVLKSEEVKQIKEVGDKLIFLF